MTKISRAKLLKGVPLSLRGFQDIKKKCFVTNSSFFNESDLLKLSRVDECSYKSRIFLRRVKVLINEVRSNV